MEASTTPVLPARASGARALDHRRDHGVNVGSRERAVSTAAGVSLFAYGASRRSWTGCAVAAAGAVLIARGATGRCPLYRSLDKNTADGRDVPRDVELTRAITIGAPRKKLMESLRTSEWAREVLPFVQDLRRDGDLLHLQVRLPTGRIVDWTTHAEVTDSTLVWRSMPDDAIDHELRIELEPAPAERGTELRASFRVRPPGGIAGAALAQPLRSLGARGLGRALQRLKQRVEAGEIATTSAQPVGRRTTLRALVSASKEAIAR
jgi:uncharacterized membrane protein